MATATTPQEEACLYRHRVCAVVPAAGHGERMKNDIPKQYLQVCGAPLVVYCLRALSEPAWIEKVILVVDEEERARKFLDQEKLPKVCIVKGNGSRHRSILAGLEALESYVPDLVIVHDGVRPIVPRDILIQVAIRALELGASGVVRPLVSTVVRPDSSNRLESSLKRSLYRNSEMPQAFRYQVILEAYRKCSVQDLDHGTECLDVALKYKGVRAYLVEGSADLWKVTHPQDIAVARLLLPKHILKVCILCLPFLALLGEGSTTTRKKFVEYDNLKISTEVKGYVPLGSFLQIFERITVSSGKDQSPPASGERCNRLKVEGNNVSMSVCCDSAAKISCMSPEIRKHSVSAHVTDSFERVPEDCGFVIVVCCVITASEATAVLSNTKRLLRAKPSTLVVVLNNKRSAVPNEEFICLKKSILEMFRRDEVSVIVIICNSDPEEMLAGGFPTNPLTHLTQSEVQLNLIIEQCLSSPLTKAFHGQIFFI